MDDLVSDHPGTRLGPRAIRGASIQPGVHLEAGVDPFAALRVVDFGDAPCSPATPCAPTRRSSGPSVEVLAAGAIPIVLGGDHSIAEPDIRACAATHGPVGLIHFDTHTDTGSYRVRRRPTPTAPPCTGSCKAGHVDPSRYVQIGLRGYWPGQEAFRVAARAGHHLAVHARHPRPRDRRRRASRRSTPSATARASCRSTSTCSIPPLPPAPGLRTRRHDLVDLLWACRTLAGRAAARRDGRRRGDPHRGWLERYHRAGRAPDGARGPDRHGPAPRERSG